MSRARICISRSTDAVGKLPCSGAATHTASSLVDIHWRNMPHDAQCMQVLSLVMARSRRVGRRRTYGVDSRHEIHYWNRNKEEAAVDAYWQKHDGVK